jgi:hypothetical protein
MPGYVELDKLSLEAKDKRFVAKYKNAEKELSVDESGLLAIE